MATGDCLTSVDGATARLPGVRGDGTPPPGEEVPVSRGAESSSGVGAWRRHVWKCQLSTRHVLSTPEFNSLLALLLLLRPPSPRPHCFASSPCLQAGCCTTHAVTESLVASGVSGWRHPGAFHRFFSRARWSLDELGRLLLLPPGRGAPGRGALQGLESTRPMGLDDAAGLNTCKAGHKSGACAVNRAFQQHAAPRLRVGGPCAPRRSGAPRRRRAAS